jgi:hypothetical protein
LKAEHRVEEGIQGKGAANAANRSQVILLYVALNINIKIKEYLLYILIDWSIKVGGYRSWGGFSRDLQDWTPNPAEKVRFSLHNPRKILMISTSQTTNFCQQSSTTIPSNKQTTSIMAGGVSVRDVDVSIYKPGS